MGNFDFSGSKWSGRKLSLFYFYELNIAIMSIELAREKSREIFLGRKVKMYLASRGNDFETKERVYFLFPDLPPWTHVFDGMMQS